MAPNVLEITNQKENHICPCCQRLVFLPKPSVLPVRKTSTSHNLDEKKLKINMTNSVSNLNNEVAYSLTALQDTQISSASCQKLIAFVNSREQEHRSAATENSTSFQGNHGLTSSSSNLAFISHQRKCVGNVYITPGNELRLQNDFVRQNDVTANAEVAKLAKVFQTVESCLWYWGDITNQEARKILENQPVGTFLLRSSSDPRFLFSLSVVADFGPTSIRIVYLNGKFDFESDESGSNRKRSSSSIPNPFLEEFQQCVVHLILHYTELLGERCENKNDKETSFTSLLPSSDNLADKSINASDVVSPDLPVAFLCTRRGPTGLQKFPLVLGRPHCRRTPSLCEQARIAINKQTKLWDNPHEANSFPLSNDFINFLKIYPYPI